MAGIRLTPALEQLDTQESQEGKITSKKNTVLVSHGRPPCIPENILLTTWALRYGEDGQRICDAFVIGVAEELALAHANMLDFDHPDALDMPMFAACLADLKACKQSNIPIYSFAEHQRLPETKYLYGATIIIAEGIMALVDPVLRALYDLKVFVQCDSDLMLARRIRRDVHERSRNVDGILDQ
ncbi:hypothetical protein H1R20_g14210, partial [Candolleomyces eurysporus]